MKRAVICARFSSAGQTEQSIVGQVQDCERYAKDNGYEILEKYIDRGISGTTDKRPAFLKMIDDSYNHGFDVVLVWKYDRFSRDRLDSMKYKTVLAHNKVKLVSINEHISDDTGGIVMESVLDAMSEVYSKDLSQKVNRGLKINAENGKYMGGTRTYGYKNDNGRYAIVEEEAVFVREIFRMFNEDGLSMRGVARKLQEKGIIKSNGKLFDHNAVEKILQNPRYYGLLRYHDVSNPNGIPPIIDKETFDKAQMRMRKNQRTPGTFKAKQDYLLAGKMFCKKCSEKMVGITGNSKTGKKYFYYKCKTAHHHKCSMKQVWKDDVENTVVLTVINLLADKTFLKGVADRMLLFQGQDTPIIKALKAKKKKIQAQLDNILSAIKDGVYTKSTKKALEDLEKEIDTIDSSITKEELGNPSMEKEDIMVCLLGAREIALKEEGMRRTLVHKFVNSVFLGEDNKTLDINIGIFGVPARKKLEGPVPEQVCISTELVRHYIEFINLE